MINAATTDPPYSPPQRCKHWDIRKCCGCTRTRSWKWDHRTYSSFSKIAQDKYRSPRRNWKIWSCLESPETPYWYLLMHLDPFERQKIVQSLIKNDQHRVGDITTPKRITFVMLRQRHCSHHQRGQQHPLQRQQLPHCCQSDIQLRPHLSKHSQNTTRHPVRPR